MKNVLLLVLALCSSAVFAQAATFNLNKISVSDTVALVYAEVLKTPFVLDSTVLDDDRLVSYRVAFASPLKRIAVVEFLTSLGLAVVRTGDTDYVSRPTADVLLNRNFSQVVYNPLFRDVSFLTETLKPLFKIGSFTSQRQVASPRPIDPSNFAPPGTAAAAIDRSSDVLLFNGPLAECELLRAMLPKIDTRSGEVVVRGYIFEVASNVAEGSGFSLALSLLGGKFSLVTSPVTAADNFLRLRSNVLDAVYSALSTDSRFKVVSSPSLRVRSGASGRFTVGQDVPILGAVSYPGNGAPPVQSVEYRSSGVIFDLSPRVRAGAIDIDLTQQLSSFVTTNSGVNNSPTLIKREVKTAVTLDDGEIVVMGGLVDNKNTDGGSGLSFLPSVFRSSTSQKSSTDILLVLQVNRI